MIDRSICVCAYASLSLSKSVVSVYPVNNNLQEMSQPGSGQPTSRSGMGSGTSAGLPGGQGQPMDSLIPGLNHFLD